jgi:hypothetical protein
MPARPAISPGATSTSGIASRQEICWGAGGAGTRRPDFAERVDAHSEVSWKWTPESRLAIGSSSIRRSTFQRAAPCVWPRSEAAKSTHTTSVDGLIVKSRPSAQATEPAVEILHAVAPRNPSRRVGERPLLASRSRSACGSFLVLSAHSRLTGRVRNGSN